MPTEPDFHTLRDEYYWLLRKAWESPSLRKSLLGSGTDFQRKIKKDYKLSTGQDISPRDHRLANFLAGKSRRTLDDLAYFTETVIVDGARRPVFWGHLEELRKVEWPPLDPPLIYWFEHGSDNLVDQSSFAEETAAADAVQSQLLSVRSPSPPSELVRHAFDGADVLPLELGRRLSRGDAALGAQYKAILFALPTAQVDLASAEEMLTKVYERLGISKTDNLAETLRSRRVLLILSGAERIRNEGAYERAFRETFSTGHVRDVCRLLLLRSEEAVPTFQNVRQINLDEEALSVPALSPDQLKQLRDPEDLGQTACALMDRFRELVAHYAARRPPSGRPVRDPTDYRDRLAEWEFSIGAQGPRGLKNRLRLCDIRNRAFLSANRDLFSMDVTAGFATLSGLGEAHWPDEIRIYHRVVSMWLADQDSERGKRELLEFISTGLFWVSEATLSMLCKMEVYKLQPDGGARGPDLFVSTTLSQRKKILADLVECGLVRQAEASDSFKDQSVYMMPLAVRAIVQDRWCARDLAARSVAHLAIANRMTQKARDRLPLVHELPFAPVLGRGRRFSLLETIRHALCAARTGDLTIAEKGADKSPYRYDQEIFPLAYPGSSPEYLHAVTYMRLFMDEMNGGEALALVQRYGLHRVAAEALYLFESAEFTPPDPIERARFRRMQAYASLEIGALEMAQEQFGLMMEAAAAIITPFDKNRFQFGALMGQIDVALERGDTSAVEALLASAAPLAETPPEMPAAAKTDQLRRLAARRAALCLQRPDGHADALRILSDNLDREVTHTSADEDDRALVRARLVSGNNGHRFIEATIAAAQGCEHGPTVMKTLKRARITCGDNALFGRNGGNLHSQIGYRIQYASLQRLLGEVQEAEAELERIRDHIMNYGASVRTLFALQLEAGETLMARDKSRPARALCMYLMPCFTLSERLGYTIWKRRAAVAGLRATQDLIRRLTKEPNSSDTRTATDLSPTSTGYAIRQPANAQSGSIPQHLFTHTIAEPLATEISTLASLEKLHSKFEKVGREAIFDLE